MDDPIPGIEITETNLGSVTITQTTPEAGRIVVTAAYVEKFVELIQESGKRAIELRKSRSKSGSLPNKKWTFYRR